MKSITLKLILILMAAGNAFGADVTLICKNPKKNAKPEDAFILRFEGKKKASMTFIRKASRTGHTHEAPIPGCVPAAQALIDGNKYSVTCEDNGDKGIVNLVRSRSGKITGSIQFPEGAIGYRDDTVIAVECTVF